MRELSKIEVRTVAGGGLASIIEGTVGGLTVGAMKGGVAGGSVGGILGFGLISGLFGTIVGGALGAANGLILGATTDDATMQQIFTAGTLAWVDPSISYSANSGTATSGGTSILSYLGLVL